MALCPASRKPRGAAAPAGRGGGGGVPAARLGSGTLWGQQYTLGCYPKVARPEFCHTGTSVGSGTGVSVAQHGTARLLLHAARQGRAPGYRTRRSGGAAPGRAGGSGARRGGGKRWPCGAIGSTNGSGAESGKGGSGAGRERSGT